jgi:hypothetical protein
MMSDFIQAHPRLWNEDIGVDVEPHAAGRERPFG